LEAGAVLGQPAEAEALHKVRRMITVNFQPGIHVTCVEANCLFPFIQQRNAQTLPFRPQHFARVARGEVLPAISLPETVSLSEWM
jgi:hypothetical protein